MSTKTIRSLTNSQIMMLRNFPISGGKTYRSLVDSFKWPEIRTLNRLIDRGLVIYNSDNGEYRVRWGWLSVPLFERIFPGSHRDSYIHELKRLEEMALDFSEGSNASFMRQIQVVKNLREMVIKAENKDARVSK